MKLVEHLKDDPRYPDLFRGLSWPNLEALLSSPGFQTKLTSKDHQRLWYWLVDHDSDTESLLDALEDNYQDEFEEHLPYVLRGTQI